MKFTDKLWEAIAPIYNDILQMPFVEELQDGTLPLAKFQFYMLQDAKYLEHFGRALAAIGAKLADNQQALDFFDFGKNALIVEKALHEAYFEDFGLAESTAIQIEPWCHHYIHFLKSTVAFESVEVALAAVLPCFWIYQEIGDAIVARQTPGENVYKRWIETYSGEDFAKSVQLAKHYVDLMSENTTDQIRQNMLEAFVTASKLEFHFWNAAYNGITW